jgi:enamine deaminase RidA (YjgF/YER057c/UK114 family)
MSVYDKLSSLGITLPPVSTPAAAYVPFVRTGQLVFVSGHIARKDGKPWVGQLGAAIATDEGKQAARAIAVDLLGTLHAAVGDLNKVKRIVKLMSLVNSVPTFTEQHVVTNGASELFAEVFGPEKGAHARSAFGVAQIPMGACVEIELIAEIDSAATAPRVRRGAAVLRRWGPSCSPAPPGRRTSSRASPGPPRSTT